MESKAQSSSASSKSSGSGSNSNGGSGSAQSHSLDPACRAVLLELGLSEYIPAFEHEQVSHDVLLTLKESSLKELIPKVHAHTRLHSTLTRAAQMGPRQKLLNWQEAQKNSIANSADEKGSSSSSSSSSSSAGPSIVLLLY